jgi:hypothetical protein
VLTKQSHLIPLDPPQAQFVYSRQNFERDPDRASHG